MDERKLEALLNLLDEPDEPSFLKIREQIWGYGKDAIPRLETALENAFNPLVQERIQEILKKLRQETLFQDLLGWARLGSSNLLQGYLLVTRSQYPDLDEEKLTIELEQLRMKIWLELNDNLTPLENIKVMNHILFDVMRFEGNKIDLNAPRNQYLNTLLESRRGSPISLGMLYMILANKLNLPVYGIDLPQHFVLAYLSDFSVAIPSEEDVLFYINPFNKGAIFTRREIELFLRQMKLRIEPAYFTPCSNIDIIDRLINALINAYTQLGYPDQVRDLEVLLKALK